MHTHLIYTYALTLPKPKYNFFNPYNVTRMCVFRADHLCGCALNPA